MRKSLFLVVVLPLLFGGCAAPWAAARGVQSAADAALEQLEPLIPADAAGRDEALLATRTALELGSQAIDIWEREATNEAPTGWTKWVVDALRGLGSLLTMIKGFGVPIPDIVQVAINGLMALVPLFAGMT